MSFKQAFAKLKESKEFKSFKKKNPDAYLCAGFFVVEYDSNRSLEQLDYQTRDGIVTFTIDMHIEEKEAEQIEQKRLEKISEQIKIDLEEVEKLIKEQLSKLKDSSKVNKLIAVLQSFKGKDIWNITAILESMHLLRMHIDAQTGKILKTEKASMFDFIKKI